MAIVLILSMLSACAGTPASEREVPGDQGTTRTAPSTYAEAVDASVADVSDPDELLLERSAVAAAHRGSRYDHARDPRHHHHREPSPEAQHAAEVTLLLMGSVFLCSFVVVVLNGACEFGAHTGYYY